MARGRLRERLRDQGGFFSGSLIEPMVCVPMLVILMLAGFLLLNDTMKSQARIRSNTLGYQHAQQAFDSVARDLRRANSVTYETPNQTMDPKWGSYGVGETNRITVNMVLPKPYTAFTGPAPRDVTYRCYYTTTPGVLDSNFPVCAKTWVADNSWNWLCWIYPSGGKLSGTADSGGIVIPGSNSPCWIWAPGFGNSVQQAQINRNNDFAWVNYDVGVFQFVDSQGAAVDPTAAGVSPAAVEFHPKVCLKVPNCGALVAPLSGAGYGGSKRLLELKTTVAWRNRPVVSGADNTCDDGDTSNDPPATIVNPDWPAESPQYIPNPDNFCEQAPE